ncbi:hypothetical protein HMF8227_02126 [Saliniradius amylolyticus]|uniref:DUF1415 domain-containing protein n=1 Tax=Saliniradius amylolyticus TaxID=2183582 RepID=A0A2S2E4L4_9ALTE|nr:DUF1415 domain-containing protein [Saliniradius amylolyticus]AWL12584.1 hypothetical protein HMF8227_02126 [Saliniradius amylolyticus]
MTDNDAIGAVKHWVEQVVVGQNFCPFARPEVQKQRICYTLSSTCSTTSAIDSLLDECERLDSHADTSTTLLIFDVGFADFDDFLHLINEGEQALIRAGYEGTYQLAHFHPQYCFDGLEEQDAANYTNRAPYPVLHILREAQLSEALANYNQPDNIPKRNIKKARQLQASFFEKCLADCHRQAKC